MIPARIPLPADIEGTAYVHHVHSIQPGALAQTSAISAAHPNHRRIGEVGNQRPAQAT